MPGFDQQALVLNAAQYEGDGRFNQPTKACGLAIPGDVLPFRNAIIVSASEDWKGSVGQLSAKSGSTNIFSMTMSLTSIE